ncbi:MAG TPA: rRNA maturation RNase YbeY [Candidatus Paceibacterota bacterium]|nr:rRNA maturation RNase YbeY [Candidatus Paceibacterota bacterium]
MALSVDVVSDKKFSDLRDNLEKRIINVLDYLGKDDVLVEIALVSNDRMALINKKSRDKKGTTTVLSFEDDSPQPKGKLLRLGEIYLAPDFIESKEMSLVRVAVHGLLHLLGYTHNREDDTIKMESVEDKIFDYLGLEN